MSTPVAMKSNLFKIQIGDGAATENFTSVGASTDLQFKLSTGTVDVTTKDSAAWQSMLEGGGMKSVQVTGSLMLFDVDATQASMRSAALGTSNKNFKIVNQKGDAYTFRGLVSEWSEKGAVNGVHTADFTIQSDGAVNFTTGA